MGPLKAVCVTMSALNVKEQKTVFPKCYLLGVCVSGRGGDQKVLGVYCDGERGTNKLSHLMPGIQIGSLRASQPLKVLAD